MTTPQPSEFRRQLNLQQAAPDLLAALQEALPYLDELYKLNTYAGVIAQKMRAAIAKATS